jgi:DNA-binding transcriptional MocR family regulator
VTVQRAVDQLVAEGLLVTRPGAGTYVARDDRPPSQSDLTWQTAVLGATAVDPLPLERLMPQRSPSAIVLSSGYLDRELQPGALLSAATQRALRRPGVWDHSPSGGDDDLRSWFASSIGGGRRAADVIVAPGGQAALSSTFRALAPPGAAVIVESPTYPGALLAARAAGLRVVPWQAEPMPDPAVLDDLLAATGARLVYAQSRFANPTGASWTDDTRTAVREVLARRRTFLIDDDWAADLSLQGVPPPSFAADDPDGHVVTIRSLTKLMAPSMRVAAVAARGPAARRIAATRLLDDLAVSGLLQQTAVELIPSPAWPKHVRRVVAELAARRDVLIAEVEDWLGAGSCTHPTGGLHTWVRLPDAVDPDRLAADAAAAGVGVSAGTAWYPGEPPGPRLRLSYSAAGPEQIRAGIDVLRALAPTPPR